ncbi:DUF1758 domain-containing protein [Trichonephila clavipes]|nr:DUF1758 domain-containing protein [Trichonephila clavipes]
MMKRKRVSYTADFKLNAVEKANEVGNREAARFFNVDESNIRLWRRNKTNFENCDRRKRADRRGKPHWPELEAEINKWILKERDDGKAVSTIFLVVLKITDFLPVSQINLNNLKIPQELADPNFGVPGKIDLLIETEAFFDIIKEGIIRTSDNALVFRSSVFGYIATGTTHSYKQNQYCGFISEMQTIDDNLQKFWEIETINEGQKPLNKEEEYCENHYQMTHAQ